MTANSRIESVMLARDPEVLRAMLEFYPRPAGPIVDLTANRRRMWKGLDVTGVTFCDIDPAVSPDIVCDFRQTPFEAGSVSAVVFDPPHLPSAAASPKSLRRFGADYGLGRSVAADDVAEIFPAALAEIARILAPDGLAFCKLSDYVHNHQYRWILCRFIAAVEATAGLTPCDLIVKRDPAGGKLTSGRWEKAHHARRCHAWWTVVRKGKCEPRG